MDGDSTGKTPGFSDVGGDSHGKIRYTTPPAPGACAAAYPSPHEDRLPLPTLLMLAIAIGIAAALAGGNELRLSPRHALLTSCFSAYASFMCLLLVPVSVYFYIFHGDWFLLYFIDVGVVPSAVALLGFVAEGAVGVGGFSLGAALARNQRVTTGGVLIALCVLASVLVLILFPARLSVVGTYAQFEGNFGLEPYGGVLMKGGAAMAGYIAVGTAFLLLRIRLRPSA